MKYFEEAKYLWQTYVPPQGQAETVQGELIRAIEKLRDEAQRNGNINWDKGFVRFCDYIEKTLCESEVFEKSAKKEIRKSVKMLRKYKRPYLEDDIYDELSDRIVEWYLQNKEPIPKPYDPKLYR
ncbi:hypothetical protein [Paenibacillus macerans]|uniref:hypothetical protein n=1 Tax=Paenibacillus macerans TaxID=44252 RepID=UPI00203D1FD3|nr:hypothetical protein [Paenibacillus macerans]MCM3700682.1 hypothetical protein [Paenibacillus macerans]